MGNEELEKLSPKDEHAAAGTQNELNVTLKDCSVEGKNDSVIEHASRDAPATAVPDIGSEKSHRNAAFDYEFGGPLGTLMTIIFLPAVVFGLHYLCNDDFCADYQTIRSYFSDSKSTALKMPLFPRSFFDVVTWKSIEIFLGWFLFQFIVERTLPATILEGTVLANSERLKYRINGHLAFWITLLLILHGYPKYDNAGTLQYFTSFPLAYLYDHFSELAVASCIFSFILSVFLYCHSFRSGRLLAKPGNSGNPIYDFFMGRELNPRPTGNQCTFDLKFFCELRPGLIGWTVLNFGMLAKQIERYGFISPGMVVVIFGQGMYVWDALYYEKSVLSTTDITSDGFGYMLAFGDLAWVPFIYTMQAKYLVDHDPHYPSWYYIFLLAIHFCGYTIFRGSNSQKDQFRRDPSSEEVSHLKFMQTKRGTKLLVSGYWGAARKINYTGDWLMSLSWSLSCGFESPVPYFYIVYFTVLLIHRASRDDHACRLKYGDDWTEYKRIVPHVFIPKII